MNNKYLIKLATDLDIAKESEQEEVEAIKVYAQRLRVAKDPDLIKAIEHARREEMDHAERFAKVIAKLTNEQISS